MALGELQSALARLFTDEAARADFLCDPRAAGPPANLLPVAVIGTGS